MLAHAALQLAIPQDATNLQDAQTFHSSCSCSSRSQVSSRFGVSTSGPSLSAQQWLVATEQFTDFWLSSSPWCTSLYICQRFQLPSKPSRRRLSIIIVRMFPDATLALFRMGNALSKPDRVRVSCSVNDSERCIMW